MPFSNSQFSLAVQNKYCKTSCKRDVTLCNVSIMCCSIAAFVVKSTVDPDSTTCNASCSKNVASLYDCAAFYTLQFSSRLVSKQKCETIWGEVEECNSASKHAH